MVRDVPQRNTCDVDILPWLLLLLPIVGLLGGVIGSLMSVPLYLWVQIHCIPFFSTCIPHASWGGGGVELMVSFLHCGKLSWFVA